MPFDTDDKMYYDFEADCNIDNIVNNFFSKFNDEIKGDKEYISYKINTLINKKTPFVKERGFHKKLFINL